MRAESLTDGPRPSSQPPTASQECNIPRQLSAYDFRPGNKFGADYVRYPVGGADSGIHHSHGDALVVLLPAVSTDRVVEPESSLIATTSTTGNAAGVDFVSAGDTRRRPPLLTWRGAVGLARTAGIVRKRLIVCADDPTDPSSSAAMPTAVHGFQLTVAHTFY